MCTSHKLLSLDKCHPGYPWGQLWEKTIQHCSCLSKLLWVSFHLKPVVITMPLERACTPEASHQDETTIPPVKQKEVSRFPGILFPLQLRKGPSSELARKEGYGKESKLGGHFPLLGRLSTSWCGGSFLLLLFYCAENTYSSCLTETSCSLISNSPVPSPRPPPFQSLILWLWLFQISHMGGIMQHLFFYA